MIESCFFCQNLLSDFEERLLPGGRQHEIEDHLAKCKNCRALHEGLKSQRKLLSRVKLRTIPRELSLRILNETTQGSKLHSPKKMLLYATAMLFVALTVALSIPQIRNPLLGNYAIGVFQPKYVQYFPMIQGAAEVLEDHANWIQSRDIFSVSLWEEGGLSPEEFEKTFQVIYPAVPKK